MNNYSKDVLLADDDPDDVYLFSRALGDINNAHKLLVAGDSSELFAVLQKEKPHIIFLDYFFPPGTGLSCVAEIRKNQAYDDIPVVVHATSLPDKIAQECIEKGAASFIQKSVTYKGMVDNIKSMMDLHCR